MLVFLGIVNFTFVGKSVAFPEAQWGQAFWALILAAIWVWVAMGFWNVRAYAAQFGIFISLFTLIFGFMALLFGSSMEAETVPWLLAGAIFLYLSYPGVQQQFVEHELSLMTPAQRAAVRADAAANAAMLQAQGRSRPRSRGSRRRRSAPARAAPAAAACPGRSRRAAHRSARSRRLTEPSTTSRPRIVDPGPSDSGDSGRRRDPVHRARPSRTIWRWVTSPTMTKRRFGH